MLGKVFPAPFGLAGGFDKDARAVRGLTMLGFAFVEIGTVTAHPQPGNERPRLWRELDVQGVRNRMGFNNEGAEAAARRLAALRSTRGGRAVLVGANIGKTKVTPAEEAAADYATSAGLLAPYADYLVVNVSSPNTPGLRDLQEVESLRPILVAVREAADAATADAGVGRPLLVKIAPDLADEDVDAVADLVDELDLDGVVAVNTTIGHDRGPGGLSGPPVRARGLAVVARLRERLGPQRDHRRRGSPPRTTRATTCTRARTSCRGTPGSSTRDRCGRRGSTARSRGTRSRARTCGAPTRRRHDDPAAVGLGARRRRGRALAAPVSPVFTTQYDAEQWLGETWRSLAAEVPPPHGSCTTGARRPRRWSCASLTGSPAA